MTKISNPDRRSASNTPPASRLFFRRLRSIIFRSEPLYRLYLQCRYGRAHLASLPKNAKLPNKVLLSKQECIEAAERGRSLGLPLHRSLENNWDHLEAVYAIVNSVPKSANILDAGAELYSNVLPALFACGFSHLFGMNLSFTFVARRGPIQYLPGDITRTGFRDSFFDAITCMSVIEHGVPLRAYFQEMFRILKPGGILITSTDYYSEPIDTKGQDAYGAPIKIFSRNEVESILSLSAQCGFEVNREISLDCAERPVHWEPYGLEYTFVMFTLRKPN